MHFDENNNENTKIKMYITSHLTKKPTETFCYLPTDKAITKLVKCQEFSCENLFKMHLDEHDRVR